MSEKIVVHRDEFPGGWVYEKYEDNTFEFFHLDPATGQKTFYTFKPAEQRHPDLPVFQPLIHEIAKDDGTIALFVLWS